MYLVQLPISILLFMVLFFGIGFILNMLLKATWLMVIIYPIIVILIVDKVPFSDYFTNTAFAFKDLLHRFVHLAVTDIIILISGLIGSIIAGIVIKMLRKNGYQMF